MPVVALTLSHHECDRSCLGPYEKYAPPTSVLRTQSETTRTHTDHAESLASVTWFRPDDRSPSELADSSLFDLAPFVHNTPSRYHGPSR